MADPEGVGNGPTSPHARMRAFIYIHSILNRKFDKKNDFFGKVLGEILSSDHTFDHQHQARLARTLEVIWCP